MFTCHQNLKSPDFEAKKGLKWGSPAYGLICLVQVVSLKVASLKVVSSKVVGVELSRCPPIRLATCRVAVCRVLIVGWQPVALPLLVCVCEEKERAKRFVPAVCDIREQNRLKTSDPHSKITKIVHVARKFQWRNYVKTMWLLWNWAPMGILYTEFRLTKPQDRKVYSRGASHYGSVLSLPLSPGEKLKKEARDSKDQKKEEEKGKGLMARIREREKEKREEMDRGGKGGKGRSKSKSLELRGLFPPFVCTGSGV